MAKYDLTLRVYDLIAVREHYELRQAISWNLVRGIYRRDNGGALNYAATLAAIMEPRQGDAHQG